MNNWVPTPPTTRQHSTCGYASKALGVKKRASFFRKRAFFEQITKVWKLRFALKFGQKIPKKVKLWEGIPFFEIGKNLISKLCRKIEKQKMAISKNPRTILKTNPLGLNCAEIYLGGRC